MTAAALAIVGGGLAAASATRTLRRRGFDGDIVVVTAEPHHPYERPPLTKDYLRGETGRSEMFNPGEDWYRGNGIDVRSATTAVGLDPAAHRLWLSDGSALEYAKLLLATGSAPRPLDVPGSDLRGVHMLRTVDQADALAESLADARRDGGGRLVVIGDGWIGMEVAASARMMGLDVTVLGRGPVPLGRVLGEELGSVYARLHRDNGVDVRSGVRVARIVGAASRVTGVELADGVVIPADVVLIGIGATPNTGLAAAAGIDVRRPELGGGIAVDGTMATSAPDVFAAGDVASIPSPRWRRPLRVEHWATALRTGPHAAKAMLGADARYERLPYFYSDQFDTSMEYVGFVAGPDAYDRVLLTGDPQRRSFLAFWTRRGVVEAGMSMNLPNVIDEVERLIASRQAVSEDELHAVAAAAATPEPAPAR